ncbi:MAG: bacillithiol system redox-active protein YtxJ [Croceivirga sp.]
MGLFGNIFGGNQTKEEKELPWIPLTAKDQLQKIQEESNSRPQIIFKHSTTCGISRMVLGMFTRQYALDETDAHLYFLDLQAHREVSNEVAAVLQVIHQSPQMLVVKNGHVIFHASHGAISEVGLEQFL